MIDFLRPYSPDLVGWFRDFGERRPTTTRTAITRASMPIFGAFQFQRTATAADAGAGAARRSGSPGSTTASRAAAPAPPASRAPTARTRSRAGGFDCDPADVLARAMSSATAQR